MPRPARLALALALAPAFVACSADTSAPDQPLIDDARARVEAATLAIGDARAGLELVNMLPEHTCGQSREELLVASAEHLRERHSCAAISIDSSGASADVITVTFPADGCRVLGHEVAGAAVFLLSWGEPGVELTVDFGDLVVDGASLGAAAGYRTCGVDDAHWVTASGAVRGHESLSFAVDARAVSRRRATAVCGAGVILDGSVDLHAPLGTDSVTFTGLEYGSGDELPRSGVMAIRTAAGSAVRARFHRASPLQGEVQITIDDYDAVAAGLGL